MKKKKSNPTKDPQQRPSKPVSASKVEMTELVFPNDANPLGNVMGGRVMQWVDICAAIAAGRHANTPVVTASVDKIDFHRPVRVGGVLVLYGSVNFAGRTSMEVGVKVFNEDLTISKSFNITDEVRMRFVTAVGNIFNRTTFCNPNTNFSSPAFGTVSTQCNQARSVQFG